MAAPSSRYLQALKAHIPLIKFPTRGRPAVQAAPTSQQTIPQIAAPMGGTQVFTSTSILPTTPMGDTYSKPVGSIPRGSGIDDKDLPLKYRRRPLEMEEIEFIERGGPA